MVNKDQDTGLLLEQLRAQGLDKGSLESRFVKAKEDWLDGSGKLVLQAFYGWLMADPLRRGKKAAFLTASLNNVNTEALNLRDFDLLLLLGAQGECIKVSESIAKQLAEASTVLMSQ